MTVDRSTLPPMMQRYLKYKDEYPDTLLFFQVGDFYELFFEDAVTVSRALNLTLTARDKTADSPIPMCGVPISVIDSYVDRLVTIGLSSAIVSQVASTVNGKPVIDRELSRIVTPGNRLFSNLDSDSTASLVVAVAFDTDGRHAALAWTDPRNGVISVKESVDRADLVREIGMIAPREIVLPRTIAGETLDRRQTWIRSIEQLCGGCPARFRPELSELPSRDCSAIEGYPAIGPTAKRSTRLLVSYLDETTVGTSIQIRGVQVHSAAAEMVIDAATRRNLEIVTNARDGSDRGTLFDYMNMTVTPSGARALRRALTAPATEKLPITRRLDCVAAFKQALTERSRIRDLLTSFPDVERLVARIELSIATPKDLGSLRDALVRVPSVIEQVTSVLAEHPGAEALSDLLKGLVISEDLSMLLVRSLLDNPPHTVHEGDIIREGFDADLDRIRGLRTDGDRWMTEFEAGEKKRTGINSLKVKRNNVIGYFLEIPSGHIAKVPDDYIRRQSTANSERFTTTELRSRETEVFGAIDKQLAKEKALFEEVRAKAQKFSVELRRLALAVTELDLMISLAQLAEREDLVRPEIEESGRLHIRDGRHPMISRRLDGGFVPNSLTIDSSGDRCCIITGPNMGGKSTYLRQAALIIIMAQVGSYVPAVSATIGLADRIFARIGASDDIHDGDSTFMVEMREASYIIANATPRSLVLIDEIGRGTATSDGLALAQAILEWLVKRTKSRTLFATHFHELTTLAQNGAEMRNLSVGSEESEDGVLFTHFIHDGPAPRSYGIEVAKLSGLPAELINRAEQLINFGEVPKTTKQLSFFAPSNVVKPVAQAQADSLVLKILAEVHPDELTPRAALDLVYRLREAADAKKKVFNA